MIGDARKPANRLEVYRNSQQCIPSITGYVIPETVGSYQSYQEQVLQPMYQDIAPRDPRGVLRHEWLNSRGAIARFDRHAIEIRVADAQECPLADVAIAAAVSAAVESLYRGQTLVQTPELQVAYSAQARSCFWQS